MTPLGKSLVFYLKYPVEMDHLYVSGGEHVDLSGLENPEQVRKMASAIGDAADKEATSFLEHCADRVDDYFESLRVGKINSRSKRATIMRNWYVQARLEQETSMPVPGGRWFFYGIMIRRREGLIVPFLWRRGGRAWEDIVMRQLSGRAHSRAGEGLVSDSGSVALPPIPVGAGQLQGFDLDSDPLVEKVVAAFAAITAEDVQVIAREVGQEDSSSRSKQDYPVADVPEPAAYGWTEAGYEVRQAIKQYTEETHADS
jgi:hypothetical protein